MTEAQRRAGRMSRPATATDSPDIGHMLFTDSAFLLRFLPLLLAFFFIAVAVTPRRWREGARRFSLPNAVLLAGSIMFLVSGAGTFIWMIAASVVLNYAVALAIGSARRDTTPSARPSPLCLRRC